MKLSCCFQAAVPPQNQPVSDVPELLVVLFPQRSAEFEGFHNAALLTVLLPSMNIDQKEAHDAQASRIQLIFDVRHIVRRQSIEGRALRYIIIIISSCNCSQD